MKTTDKILFLDFDGVLHDDAVFSHPKRGIYIKTPGHTLFEWMPILDELLKPHGDVAIVLSTTWVRMRSFDFAKKQLSPLLQKRVIGATYHRRHMRDTGFEHLARGEQIVGDVSRRKPRSWMAIDDDADGWPAWCRANLIETRPELGISDPMVQQAIRSKLQSW